MEFRYINVIEILSPEAYQNVENPQTIYVRMENEYTGTHIQNSFEIETDGILSVNDLFSEKFSMYPNPVEDVLRIDIMDTFETLTVSVHSIDGRLIFSDEINNQESNYSIDLSQLTSSIYFLKVNDELGRAFSKKIIKN